MRSDTQQSWQNISTASEESVRTVDLAAFSCAKCFESVRIVLRSPLKQAGDSASCIGAPAPACHVNWTDEGSSLLPQDQTCAEDDDAIDLLATASSELANAKKAQMILEELKARPSFAEEVSNVVHTQLETPSSQGAEQQRQIGHAAAQLYCLRCAGLVAAANARLAEQAAVETDVYADALEHLASLKAQQGLAPAALEHVTTARRRRNMPRKCRGHGPRQRPKPARRKVLEAIVDHTRREHKLQVAVHDLVSSITEANSGLGRMETLVSHAHWKLTWLRGVNLLSDVFKIWIGANCGVINGLRLGKLPTSAEADWDEINAAWGHVAHLVEVLMRTAFLRVTRFLLLTSRKAQVTSRGSESRLGANVAKPPPGTSPLKPSNSPTEVFARSPFLPKYKVLPRGSYSVVFELESGTELELHGSPGGLVNFFKSRRFDSAMTIMLGLTSDIVAFINRTMHSTSHLLEPPFAINDDKIGGNCIRLQATSPEGWTKALRCLLTDLKWLIGVVENLHA